MFSGRMFHSVAEVVSKNCLPHLIVLLCTTVAIEADLNSLVG